MHETQTIVLSGENAGTQQLTRTPLPNKDISTTGLSINKVHYGGLLVPETDSDIIDGWD